MKNVVIFSTSLRDGSNSDILADAFSKGVVSAGHQIEKISLKGKTLSFCQGCNICDSTGVCAIKDDAAEFVDKAAAADVLVFAGPMYHTNISGAMKTLLDRLTPAMARDYKFTDIYMIITAADDSQGATADAEKTLEDWTYSFKKTSIKGIIRGQGIDPPKDAENHDRVIKEAYSMGRDI